MSRTGRITWSNAAPLWCFGILFAIYATSSSAQDCDSNLRDWPTVLHDRLIVSAGTPANRTVNLAAGSTAIIIAREQGIDAVMEVSGSDGRRLARAASPLDRAGTARAIVAASTETTINVRLVPKWRTGADGTIELRVVRQIAERGDACAAAHRLLAQADAAYAAGQIIVTEADFTPTVSERDADVAALGLYTAAVDQLKELRSISLHADITLTRATLLSDDVVERWNDSAAAALAAQSEYSQAGNLYGRARAQTVRAYALMNLAVSPDENSSAENTPHNVHLNLERARAILTPAIQFYRANRLSADEVAALNFLAISYYEEGANDNALSAWDQASQLMQSLGDRNGLAQILQNMAVAESQLGRSAHAIKLFARVLDLIDQREDPMHYALVLNNTAQANWTAGHLDTALQLYARAAEIFQTVNNPTLQANSLHGLGSVYDTLGDRQLALEFYRQALPLRNASTDGPGRTATLRAIANILRADGHAADALGLHREALALSTNPYMSSRIHVQIAQDLESLGRNEDARAELLKAEQSTVAGDEINRALALREMSRLDVADGQLTGTEAKLRATIPVFRRYEAPAEEFESWVELAQLKRANHQLSQALQAVDEALRLAEDVRTQSANPELRAQLMQPLRAAFDLKIALLADQFFSTNPGSHSPQLALLALQTAESARMRALSDFENLDIGASGISQAVAERRRTLFSELATRRMQLEFELDRTGADATRVRTLRADIATLRQELDRIDAEIGAHSIKDAKRSSRIGSIALDARNIPTDTVLVEYWVGSTHTFAWVVKADRIEMFALGPSGPISDAARAYHAALRGFDSVPSQQREVTGARLQELVLQPFLAQLSSARTLIFFPDGALHYVPFASLRENQQGRNRYLVERHDVANGSSITSALRPHAQSAAAAPLSRILLVDDPVYALDDARFGNSRRGAPPQQSDSHLWARLLRGGSTISLPRLPATGLEAHHIAALFPHGAVDQLEGFSAAREPFLASALERYDFIHIASHAVTDTEIPQLSALMLSTRDRTGRAIDGRVLAADLIGKRIGARAVVLSACDTAMGRDVAGEGLIGLRYVMLARGARSVVASLWEVPDQSAEQMMTQFYSKLLRGNPSVIEALSAAARSMLGGEFNDPGVWAAFQVTVREIDTRSNNG